MKQFSQIIALVCLAACSIGNAGEQPAANTKGAANEPATFEGQLLQGTWVGVMVGDDARQKITITISGSSLHFHRDTNFWFKTAIALPASKDPKQLHATIKDCPPSQASSIGQVVRAFYKIEDGTLTLATMGDDAEETPKGFEAAGTRYELRKVQPQMRMIGSGLGSLVFEGHELHASLKTRQIDDSDQHMPRALIPGNPHVSTNAAFVAAVVRNASRSSLGAEGIRSAIYAFYREQNDLGFCGLEAVSVADADRWEEAVRKIWAHNVRLGLAQVHRKGLVLVLVWTHGVSPECWEAVNAKVVERLSAP